VNQGVCDGLDTRNLPFSDLFGPMALKFLGERKENIFYLVLKNSPTAPTFDPS
jgi:hypothetical protein